MVRRVAPPFSRGPSPRGRGRRPSGSGPPRTHALVDVHVHRVVVPGEDLGVVAEAAVGTDAELRAPGSRREKGGAHSVSEAQTPRPRPGAENWGPAG